MVTRLDAIVANIAIESEGSLTEHTPSPKIRVLIVDDHEAFRRYICSMLQAQPYLQLVGEAEDGPQAVQQAEAMQPDMILLDIGLPGLNGIAAARQIRKVAPDARIIFVSQESSSEVVDEAFSLGAFGYVTKAQLDSDLLPAIHAVSRKLRFVSSGLDGSGRLPKP